MKIIDDTIINTLKKCKSINRIFSYKGNVPECLLFTEDEKNFWKEYDKKHERHDVYLNLLCYFNQCIKTWNKYNLKLTPQDMIADRLKMTQMLEMIDSCGNSIANFINYVIEEEIIIVQPFHDSINGFKYEEEGKNKINEYNKIYIDLMNPTKTNNE